jgi:hypothetical protein
MRIYYFLVAPSNFFAPPPAKARQIANPIIAPQISIITSMGDAVRDGTND